MSLFFSSILAISAWNNTSWTFVIFLWFDVLVVTWKHWGEKWEINCNCFLRSESQESSGAQSDAVKKSFSEVFSLNRTIMASFTYMFTNSFIHPRNITGNIYHSLYHIIHWKVSQKLLGLRYSFGAIGRKKVFVFVWLTTAQENQSPRWNFISFVSTKMPDALDDKYEGDSPEQFSNQAWSHTRDSLAKVCFKPKTERESGDREQKSLVSVSRSLFHLKNTKVPFRNPIL